MAMNKIKEIELLRKNVKDLQGQLQNSYMRINKLTEELHIEKAKNDPSYSYSTATEISSYLKNNPADLIITGRESIDYNGGAVGGMIAEMLKLPFINACIGLEADGSTTKLIREIDGGKENILANLPFVIGGQKGLVEESDLKIPNMRGIMQARKKPLNVVEPTQPETRTEAVKYEKPAPKGEVKLIDPENLDELIDLLHNEAKAI